MIFEVSHKTAYHYTAPVAQAHHLVHLAPRPHERQRVMHQSIVFSPKPASRSDFTDYFGNPASAVAIENSHSELLIHSTSVVEVNAPLALDLAASTPWDKLAFDLAPPRWIPDQDAAQYLMPSHHTAITHELIAFAEPSFAAGRPVLECARDLTHRIFTEFAYDGAATDIATTTDELLNIRRGVCQDFAHLLIAAMRAFGLPARYVSGYLLTYPPEGKERLIGADASHAWASVWSPGIGWVDFDPTNDIIPLDEHITIAYGRDFHDVSPVTGVLLGGGAHQVDVAVDVTPIEKQAATIRPV
ncbi:MAG: transglutaminase family protein [Hyphomicrobiales bacterium]|nr:transglutaminase family protein [Hyphomicrobiales bacterium]